MMAACPNPRHGRAFFPRTGRNGRPGEEERPTMTIPADHQLHRLPGLFRRWELGQVIKTGTDYRIEDAGSASDGTPLFAVYLSGSAAPRTRESVR